MRGWQSIVQDFVYRQELVAGGLAGYATSEFKRAADRIGDLDGDWHEVEDQVMHRDSSTVTRNIFTESLKQLPQARLFKLLSSLKSDWRDMLFLLRY